QASGVPVFTASTQSATFGPFTSSGAYTVRFSVQEQCCGWSIPAFATISVNNDPTTPTDITFSNAQVVCVGTTITATGASGATGGITPYVYQWDYTNANQSYSGFSGTAPSFTSASGANTVRVRIAADDARGCDASGIYEETVTGNPVPVGVSASISECSGTPLSYPLTTANSVSGTLFSIISQSANPNISGTGSISGANLTGTFTNAATTNQSITFTIRPTGPAPSNCVGADFTITLTINPLPALFTVTGGGSYCSGGAGLPIGLSGSQTGVYYELYRGGSPTGIGFVGNGSAFNFSPVQTLAGVYTVVANNQTSGCERTMTGSVSITVNPLPDDKTFSAASNLICVGTSANIQLTNSQSGVTYQLRNNADNSNVGTAVSGTGATITLPTGNLSVNTTFNILATVTATGCVRQLTGTVSVNVLPNPSGGSINSLAYCPGGSGTLIVSGVSNVTGYVWSLPGALSGASTTNSISISGGTAGTVYTVTVTPQNVSGATTCSGAPFTTTVTVHPTPTVNITGNTPSFCSGGITDIVLSSAPNNVPGTTFDWTRTNTTNITGTNSATGITGSIAVTLVNTTNAPQVTWFTVTPKANGCSGSAASATVTVNPIPTVTATNNAPNICTGGSANIGLSSNVSGATFSWTRDNTGNVTGANSATGITGAITQTLTNTGATNQSTQFSITATANGCTTATPQTTTVNVGALPLTNYTLTATPSVVCSGLGATVTISSSQSGVTYQLRRADNSAVSGASVLGNGAARTISVPASELMAAGSPHTFNILATTASPFGCSAQLVNTVTIAVNQAAVAPTAATANGQSALTICPNHTENITLAATGGALNSGAVANWYEGGCGAGAPIATGTSISIAPPSATTTYYVSYYNEGCGNTTCVLVTITVEDITPPVITCPGNITVTNSPGLCRTTVTYATPTATDNCGSASIQQTGGLASGTQFTVGTTANTFKATDDYNNTAECSFTVTVTDNEAPVVNGTNGSTVVACLDAATPPTSVPAATDNCSGAINGVLVGYTDTPNLITCAGTRVYTYSYTDAASNTNYWTYTYTIEYEPFIIWDDPGEGFVSCPDETDVEPTPPDVFDNCGNELTPVITAEPKPTCDGYRMYTFTYTDCAGNQAEWYFYYFIDNQDFEVPDAGELQVACPDVTNTPPALPNVTDFCGNLLTPDLIDITEIPECDGTRTYTYLYTDCVGYQHEWQFTYLVIRNDFTLPANGSSTVSCPTAATAAAVTLPTVTADCGEILTPGTPEQNKAGTDTFDGCSGTISYTWTYADCAGVEHDWTYTFTVNDTDDPVITCPTNIPQFTDAGFCYATVSITNATATDNCTVASVVGVRSDNEPLTATYPVGTTTITWTAADDCNHTDTCQQTVVITDNQPPAALCQNVTVQLDATGNGTTTAAAVNNGSSDACGIQSLQLSKTDFDCSNVGSNSVTLTVTDVNGNQNQCNATVTV
ncbi:MAG TPA: HYR domain-containing protein, partial [Chitinophagales bacterium]|nr:HYR domain-containing protein [Chitinophagales bacterium]